MITVSDEWKKLHEQPLLPETFIEIRLDVSDVDVTELATITGTNQATFSNTNSLINKEVSVPDEQYAFLEYNLWTLDGSKDVLTDVGTYQAPGFVSKDDAVSALRVSLSEIRSAGTPGFRITWSSEHKEYATDFTIDVKQGDSIIGTTTVTGNKSSVTQVELDVAEYDTVIITVNGWSVPEHRTRIDGVTFGCAIVFDKNQILRYSHEQTGDPLGSEISKNSIEFSVDNTDGRWDLLNPGSLEKYLYERQPLTVHYGMQTNSGVEWIQAGVFYLTEWRAPSNGFEATFVARDAFEFMINATYSRTHHTGVVKTPTTANSSVTDEGILVFSTVEGIYNAQGTVTATLPIGTEVKVYERRGFFLTETVTDPNTEVYFVAFRIDQGWIRSNCVTITSSERMYDDMSAAIESCTQDIRLSWTYWNNLKSTGTPTSVPEINVAEFIQKLVNKCGYTMWQKANGKLCFGPPSKSLSDYVIPRMLSYSHPEVELTKPLKQVNVVCHYQYTPVTTTEVFEVNVEGEVITLDNPYVWGGSNSWANARAQNYIDWWKNRGWVSGEFRADPRLELFDVVSVESKYGLISPVMITQIKYTYNGSFHGIYKGKILSADLVETSSLNNEVIDT